MTSTSLFLRVVSLAGLIDRSGARQLVDAVEPGFGDDGVECPLHPHRLGIILGVGAPDQSAGVDLVSEDEVDSVLGPERSCLGWRRPIRSRDVISSQRLVDIASNLNTRREV